MSHSKREKVKFALKNIFFKYLLASGWAAVVVTVWAIIEIAVTGTYVETNTDAIVATIMSIVLWMLTKHHIEVKE